MALTFGTAGLRGPVHDGPDGMNVDTVSRATAGLAAWLHQHGHDGETVVVGRDARHGSDEFAQATAEILQAAGFTVLFLTEPGPTPLVAFACRRHGAVAGVMITASHNPKADNGYKVYLEGGAQLVEPADREIEALIAQAPAAADIRRQPVTPDPRADTVITDYLDRLTQRFGPPLTGRIRVALTALHGVGGKLALEALARNGIDDVVVVDEQFAPDPDFPTAPFPNPEEPGTTDLLLELAARENANLAIALDPDADRCAIGVPDHNGEWRMLTGDETGAILCDAVLTAWSARHGTVATATPPVVASSLVSGTLMDKLAAARGATNRRTRTGFKWLVRAGEPLIYAYEEALGHCVDPDAVRDKDGISAAVAMARLTNRLSERSNPTGPPLDAVLERLASRFGRHVTRQRSIRTDDPSMIANLMAALRNDQFDVGADADDVTVRDYLTADEPLRTDAVELTWRDQHYSWRVVARPSGTEPKLKYYGQIIGSWRTSETELNDLLEVILERLPDGRTTQR